MGGADGDLIAGGCLIDFKAHKSPLTLSAFEVHQLIGFALLDSSNLYRIRLVGFYLARQRGLLAPPMPTGCPSPVRIGP